MNNHKNSALQTARKALDECTRLLQSDTPTWDAVHAALGTAQRAAAVAEYLGKKQTEEPLPPPPAIAPPLPTEPVFEEPISVHKPSNVRTSDVAVEAPATTERHASVEPEPLPAAGASLAERLSEQPLENLKNSLSINNRVRFASLLTDGDVPALMGLCESLERSADFEAAQVLLLETAGDINWEDKESGAAEFLCLVSRLFAGK